MITLGKEKKINMRKRRVRCFGIKVKVLAEYKRITTKRNLSQMGNNNQTQTGLNHISVFLHSLRRNLAE